MRLLYSGMWINMAELLLEDKVRLMQIDFMNLRNELTKHIIDQNRWLNDFREDLKRMTLAISIVSDRLAELETRFTTG